MQKLPSSCLRLPPALQPPGGLPTPGTLVLIISLWCAKKPPADQPIMVSSLNKPRPHPVSKQVHAFAARVTFATPAEASVESTLEKQAKGAPQGLHC